MAADALSFIVEIADALGPRMARELIPTMFRQEHQAEGCTAFVL
ncbi:hypothetical protein phiMK_01 [Pseudomonas phage phiMK]|nr:hypothetical protein PaP1_gp155 [Pseudomonas phage PaP1]YP_009291068.1 hypothetical protein BI047_gp001 [Pseudomonas phage phiMK]AEK21695.1 hypothetical protein PaP1_gp155 [Pseudomonas phage PaP1]AMQ66188.1 hypothetical protein phiMK_01 [Pseudomonas phage phiMK]WKC57588.1 hypothetical protein EPA3_171 [Pseudomonas phage vB_PaM_EPA3]